MTITVEDVAALTDEDVHRVLGLLMRRIQRPERRGKWIDRMQPLAVGESFTCETVRHSTLCYAKRVLRKRLNQPDAQWITRATNKGVRVTRIR